MRFDSNGNMNLLKLFGTQGSPVTLKYFQPWSISSIGSSHVALSGRIDSIMSSIGYSSSSSTDNIIMRVDENGNIVWTTVIDYNYGYDFPCQSYSYESTHYVGMVGNISYPMIVSLNSTNGYYLKSNAFTFLTGGIQDNRGISLLLFNRV